MVAQSCGCLVFSEGGFQRLFVRFRIVKMPCDRKIYSHESSEQRINFLQYSGNELDCALIAQPFCLLKFVGLRMELVSRSKRQLVRLVQKNR